uniref:Binding-protein-dependent transport system inner membrane component n=1 Tax=Candidatus Kentrum sp. LPFa TaxID=2126335 RepID=A0A450XYH2_9GAMM|nr:MAG: hypothetical protein BECKLPF1236A_GA0070988_102544 [Candidatus Kentron sp. LPFa]VFK34287.1 MAG: hypothetical protein BECKLPF1236C_GA0070990_102574 [Candidatus Kentron sp. LPFa]
MNRHNPSGSLMIILALFLGLLLVLAPPFTMLILSFSESRFPSLPWGGWSMEWYRELFLDLPLQMSLLRSTTVGLAAAILANLLGFTAGYWFARCPNPRAIYWAITLLTLPAIIPFILYGVGFLQFIKPFGFARTLIAVIFSPVAMALSFYRCRQLNPEI